jgi:hypothetical protein
MDALANASDELIDSLDLLDGVLIGQLNRRR